MPRPKKIRTITTTPSVSGFKPYGGNRHARNNEAVFLFCEEYEALRLSDYEKYNQTQASILMRVSRPTFTRIYLSAREKIAKAFVEGKQIIIEGGKVEFDNDWYFCEDCNSSFSILENERICPLCKSTNIMN